ncbi:MAG: GNAT family N-acetyltransferase [Candidatus Phytoplasma sp.]|nr:GNAT family N-acetyltransferase [Phytoplasma sp.]
MLVMRELNHEEQDSLEAYLHNYDFEKTKIDLNKKISFGYYDEDTLVAGITGKIEGYKIFYVETLFVSEKYRSIGFGTKLLGLAEEAAKIEGAKFIRLDTFSWQAKDFYTSLGYEVIGHYKMSEGVDEYFLLKKL